VQLTFTMPPKTVAGEHLAETPAIEILRGALKPDGSPDAKSFRHHRTIPARSSALSHRDKSKSSPHLS